MSNWMIVVVVVVAIALAVRMFATAVHRIRVVHFWILARHRWLIGFARLGG